MLFIIIAFRRKLSVPKLPLWKERQKKELAFSAAWVEGGEPGSWGTKGQRGETVKGITTKYSLYRSSLINIFIKMY